MTAVRRGCRSVKVQAANSALRPCREANGCSTAHGEVGPEMLITRPDLTASATGRTPLAPIASPTKAI